MSEKFRRGSEDPNKVKKEIEEGVDEYKTGKVEGEQDVWEREEQERWEEDGKKSKIEEKKSKEKKSNALSRRELQN